MPDISIQFHADPHELPDLVSDWPLANTRLFGMSFNPFALVTIDIDRFAIAIANPSFDRFVFLRRDVNMPVSSKTAFEQAYPEQLVLDIGKVSGDSLGESWLACRTDDDAAYSSWLRIARKLENQTRHGATAVNRETGARAIVKSHRFTERALGLEQKGVRILPAGGTCVYELGAKAPY